MALTLEPSIVEKLPLTVKSALTKMSDEQQLMFQEQYKKKMKNTGTMIALAIIFPIQLFLLGKTGLGVVFLLTGGGCGVWYVLEWFMTSKRVKEYNEDIATKVLTEIKILNS